ncbi:hypothetical protein LV779_01835 [Streptomyces thinghirensis]|nr:hypothetical protein [Streptomyces thinghirensis]
MRHDHDDRRPGRRRSGRRRRQVHGGGDTAVRALDGVSDRLPGRPLHPPSWDPRAPASPP